MPTQNSSNNKIIFPQFRVLHISYDGDVVLSSGDDESQRPLVTIHNPEESPLPFASTLTLGRLVRASPLLYNLAIEARNKFAGRAVSDPEIATFLNALNFVLQEIEQP